MDFRPEMEEVEIVVEANDDMNAPESTPANQEVHQSVTNDSILQLKWKLNFSIKTTT